VHVPAPLELGAREQVVASIRAGAGVMARHHARRGRVEGKDAEHDRDDRDAPRIGERERHDIDEEEEMRTTSAV